MQFLTKKGFTKKELADAGLSNRFGGDLFRGRMTVPLMDGSGQVIGFTGRIIDDDPKAPKYLNTPQTPIYDKGRHVFGLSQAKEAIRKNDYAVIVEGNLDVVSSHQAGIEQVVATAGTAMTDNHLRALRRLTGNLRLAFDGDKAGIAATERAIPIASSVGVELTIITLPEGAKDPDELIKQDPKLWQQAVDTSQPAVDWILDQYSKREDITSAAGKRTFTTAGLNVVRGLTDPVERDHYEKKIAHMAGSSLEAVRAKLQKEASDKKPLKSVSSPLSDAIPTFDHIDTLLGLALSNPAVRELFAQINPSILGSDRRQEAASYILSHPREEIDDTPEELQNIDDYVKIVLLRAEKRYAGWDANDQYFEAAKLLRQFKTEHELKIKEQQIAEAEARGDDVGAERLRREHYTLIKEMKRG
jgi:DNA primase